MRLALIAVTIAALVVLAVSAQAMPLAQLSSAADYTYVIRVKMSNCKMTCAQMMRMQRMHQKVVGGGLMTCKQMMQMHRKMMGSKM